MSRAPISTCAPFRGSLPSYGKTSTWPKQVSITKNHDSNKGSPTSSTLCWQSVIWRPCGQALRRSKPKSPHVISVLLGQYPEDLAKELAKPGKLPALPPQITPGLPIDLLRRRVERFVAEIGAILDLQLEAANRAEALHRRRREDGDERVLHAGELALQPLGDG